MDTLTEVEFFHLFDRVTEHVSLKGCRSAEDIMLRIKASEAYRSPVKRYSKRQERWVKKKGSLVRLLTAGFQDRVMEEFAKFDRDSMITLTLLFGKEKAKEIKKRALRAKFERPMVITREERIERTARELRRREALRRRPRWRRWGR